MNLDTDGSGTIIYDEWNDHYTATGIKVHAQYMPEHPLMS